MKFRFDSTWLATDGYLASEVRIAGRQIVEEAQFLRAASAAFYARGNRSVSVTFTVARVFDSMLEAESFCLSHHDALPNQADLLVRIGLDSESTQDATLGDAVLEEVSFRQIGVSILVSYAFRASEITGIVATPTADVFESGSYAIGNGASSVTLTGLALGAVPTQVLVTVRKPAGGFNLLGTVDGSTITADGFSVYFNGQTDSANYLLDWLAILP